jgi:CubicO group peptidase (beta-lactamase class C family)
LIVALAGQQVVATAQDIRNTPRDSSTSDAYRALVGDYDSEGQLNITLHISVEGGDLVLSNSVDPTPKRLIPEDVGNLQFVIDHPTPDQVVFATDDRGNVTYCVVRLANDGVEMTFRRVSSDGEASPDQQETTAGSLADYGWDQSEAAYDSGKIDELRAMIEDGTYKQVKSVIVIKDGDLLVEEYFNGAVRDELHDPRSVSKTYASAITGIAISEGYLSGVDESLGDVYNLENYDNVGPKKEEVRIEDLLTMSSGFEGFDFDPASIGNERNMYAKTDWVKWALDLPMATERSPGDEWYYFTAGVVILGDILNRRVPGGLEAYARQKLFKPLGIERYVWPRTTQGAPSTAGGLRLTPLDMAKFGQLYFDEGEWRGQRVLPQEWVDESLRRRYQTTEGVWYGYLWWNRVYNIEGEQYEAYFCNGNGGNKILLFREHGIVIVVASSAYDEAYADPQVDQMITRYILPAVTPE